jgi:hypothetical protein
MTAFLVEQHPKAYTHLSTIQPRFPDIEIKTYPDDFISVVPRIVADIPRRASPSSSSTRRVGASRF